MLRKRYTIIVCFFLLCVWHNAYTQLDLSFHHLTTDNGISGQTRALEQDSLGYVWICTENGVNRFDGYQMKNYYSTSDTNSLSHSVIYEVMVDNKNTVWFGSQYGINRYNRDKDNFTRMYMPNINKRQGMVAPSRFFYGMCTDNDGNPYFIDEAGAVCTFNYETNKLELVIPEAIKHVVKSATFDSDGILWLGTFKGFVKVNILTKKVTYYDSDDITSKLRNEIWAITEYNDRIWLGALGENNIYIFDKQTEQLQEFTHPDFPRSFNNCFYVDKKNRIWIGTINGLYIYNEKNGEMKGFVHNDLDNESISNDKIFYITVDLQENIWLAVDQGINYSAQESNFTTYTKHGNNMPLPVGAIDLDHKNRLWVGNNNSRLIGYNQYKDHIFDEITAQSTNGWLNSDVMHIFVYDTVYMYFGAYFNGLMRYNMNTRTLKEYRPDPNDPESIVGTDMRAISKDTDGNLWIICHGHGFNKFIPSTGKFVNFNVSDEDMKALGGLWAFDITVDQNGLVWICHTAGLSSFNPETEDFIHYSTDPDDSTTISSNDVTGGMYIDPFNNFWVATQKGLNYFYPKQGKFTRFMVEQGLPDNKIANVIVDNDTNLWITHGKGLSVLYFEDKAHPHPNQYTIKNYTNEDGIGTKTYKDRTIVKSPDGTIYIGGNNAVTAFNPSAIQENKFRPIVSLTGFSLMNTPVPISDGSSEKEFTIEKHVNELKEITLTYDQNIMTFYYVGINMKQSAKNKYAYMMEGFEDVWQQVGTKREATYTNLSPGEYIFKVKAANNDGYWSKNIKSIKIIITPPWWSTWWFRILVLIIIALVIWKVIHDKQEKVKRDKALLQHKINEGEKIINDKMEEVEKQREEIRIREIREREMKYFTEGIAKFSDIITKFRGELKDLSTRFAAALVDYTDAKTGGVYLVSDDDNEVLLEPSGAFFNNPHPGEIKSYKEGEGFVGTCFKELDVIEVDNIPDGELYLNSGLGNSAIRYCLYVPINLEDTCYGVIELAAFKPIEKYQVDFVKKISESFGSVIAISKSSEKLQVMLEENKQQAEEMLAQEEEMRQNLEELQSTQEMFQRKEETLMREIEEHKKRIKELEEGNK